MQLGFSREYLVFQQEVRTFLREELPDHIAQKTHTGQRLTKDEYVAWQKILAKKGWAAPNWPKKYGGLEWSPTQRYIWANECAMAGAPDVVAFGLKMVAPVIYTYGNDEQRERFLPPILNSDVWWCQGYSEPNAGSDLASLQTKAERVGDHYIVNGVKTWTTNAQYADWIFCLVRTGGPEVKNQQAISFLLIDMTSPGITVSPIQLIDGSFEVNEVHFDNVRVPTENRIGEEGMGWTYAKILLAHERTIVAGVAESKVRIEQLKSISSEENASGNVLLEDPIFAYKLADLEIDLMALEFTELRAVAAESSGTPLGPEVSILKVKGSEISQAIDKLLLQAAAFYGHAFTHGLSASRGGSLANVHHVLADSANKYFNNRKLSIYGGSNEIQRNIIAKTVLGL